MEMEEVVIRAHNQSGKSKFSCRKKRVNGSALKILSWQTIEGMEKEKKVKVGIAHFYDCTPSHTAMTG